jgi:short-subunit dehydrogenase
VKNKTILITGAGSGIGKEISHLLENNNKLILIGRNLEKLQKIKSRNPEHIDIYVCDISNTTNIETTFQKISSLYSGIDVLINNAGISDARPFLNYTYEKIKKIFDINVTGTIYFTKTFLPLVLKNQGAVVNIGSMFGDIAHPLYSVYSSSKFAIKGFSDALRREYMHEGLSVSYVAPRATQTDALDSTKDYGQYFEMNVDQPKDVAKHIIENVKKDRDNIYPPSIERIFVFIQKIFPKVIDKNLNNKINKL